MAFHPFWFGVIVRRLPDEFQDGIVVAEGLDAGDPIEPDTLSYTLLLRAVAESMPDAHGLIKDSVRHLDYLASFAIADGASSVTRRERRVVASLKPNGVLMSASFVGFKAGCAAAQASALNMISLAVKKSWWHFWR